MRTLLLILALCVLPLATHGVTLIQSSGGGGGPGPTVLFSETFEPTPESSTCDSGGTDESWNAPLEGAGSTVSCDSTTQANGGVQSFGVTDGTGDSNLTSSGTFTPTTDGTVCMTFYVHFNSAATLALGRTTSGK